MRQESPCPAGLAEEIEMIDFDINDDELELEFPTNSDENYLNNLICTFKIKSPEGTRIQIDFETFDVEPAVNCKFDRLEIDLDSSGTPDQTLCGQMRGAQPGDTNAPTPGPVDILIDGGGRKRRKG